MSVATTMCADLKARILTATGVATALGIVLLISTQARNGFGPLTDPVGTILAILHWLVASAIASTIAFRFTSRPQVS